MIAKAQADSVCAFFGNVEINFTLRSVFTLSLIHISEPTRPY